MLTRRDMPRRCEHAILAGMLHDRDYVMRLVREFSSFLVRLLTRHREEGGESTLVDLDEAAGRFVGMSMPLLELLPVGQLRMMLSTTGALATDRAYAAGMLLEARGRLASEAGDEAHAEECYRKALVLLLDAEREFGGFLNDEHERAAQRLTELLG